MNQQQMENGVHVGRGQVGAITSGMLSPVLGKNIALCKLM